MGGLVWLAQAARRVPWSIPESILLISDFAFIRSSSIHLSLISAVAKRMCVAGAISVGKMCRTFPVVSPMGRFVCP